MTVKEDLVRWPDGNEDSYGVVEKPYFALVVPRGEGGFWMVEQFRYAVGRRTWEFPQGAWSHGSSGPPADLARTELAEETGITAAYLEQLGTLCSAYGFCAQSFGVF